MARIIQFPKVGRNNPQIEGVLASIRRLEERFERRPFRPATDSPLQVKRAPDECPFKCKTCFLECAILPERIAWWKGELARLGGATPKHDIAAH